MQVVPDTGFIVHCIRKNIDFISQLEELGFKLRIPREVMQELRHLEHDVKTSKEDKNRLNKILDLFEDRRRFKRVSIGGGKMSDWLVKKDAEGFIVASLDSSIKHKLSRRVTLHEGTGRIEVNGLE